VIKRPLPILLIFFIGGIVLGYSTDIPRTWILGFIAAVLLGRPRGRAPLLRRAAASRYSGRRDIISAREEKGTGVEGLEVQSTRQEQYGMHGKGVHLLILRFRYVIKVRITGGTVAPDSISRVTALICSNLAVSLFTGVGERQHLSVHWQFLNYFLPNRNWEKSLTLSENTIQLYQGHSGLRI
jgi:hypothetical protein